MRGVILYGPPASGKDTITRHLTALDSAYQLFPRLKRGPGRTDGYRMVTDDQLRRLRSTDGVVWENHRYGATYVVDYEHLIDMLVKQIPVLHLGRAEGIEAVIDRGVSAVWTVVELWCPWEIAPSRIAARGTQR